MSRNQVAVDVFQGQCQRGLRGIVCHDSQRYSDQRGFILIQLTAVRGQGDRYRCNIQRITAHSNFNHCITGRFPFQGCGIGTILIIFHCSERGSAERGTEQYRLSGHQVTVDIFQRQFQRRFRRIIRHNTQRSRCQYGFVLIQIRTVSCQFHRNRRHIQRITTHSDFDYCITGGFPFQRRGIGSVLIILHGTERGSAERGTEQHGLTGNQVTVGIFQRQLQR